MLVVYLSSCMGIYSEHVKRVHVSWNKFCMASGNVNISQFWSSIHCESDLIVSCVAWRCSPLTDKTALYPGSRINVLRSGLKPCVGISW